MSNDLVSIIMLSRNRGQFVEESVRSILAQTYTNWELLFVDDNSKDDTISRMMAYKQQDRRIRLSQSVYREGPTATINSALKSARGRWMAFLNCGDLWEPEKLERQIRFMEDNGYSFSYTKFRMVDRHSKDLGLEVGGLERVTHRDFFLCCWPAYLTVIYDAQKVGLLQVTHLKENNDYALWLDVSEKADCYLLKEPLGSLRLMKSWYNPFPVRDKLRWRYEVYRKVEDLNPLVSAFMTVVNLMNGILKKLRYGRTIAR